MTYQSHVKPEEVSAELLDQPDDDAGGATDVAVPVDVLVLRHLAHEFGAVGAQSVEKTSRSGRDEGPTVTRPLVFRQSV